MRSTEDPRVSGVLKCSLLQCRTDHPRQGMLDFSSTLGSDCCGRSGLTWRSAELIEYLSEDGECLYRCHGFVRSKSRQMIPVTMLISTYGGSGRSLTWCYFAVGGDNCWKNRDEALQRRCGETSWVATTDVIVDSMHGWASQHPTLKYLGQSWTYGPTKGDWTSMRKKWGSPCTQ